MPARSTIIFGLFLMLSFGLLRIETVVTFEYDRPDIPRTAGKVLAETAERVGMPTRITIPSIAVEAAIEEVALTEDGAMDVPDRPQDTVWYGLGPRPGEKGSAVIAGHVDWKDGKPAIFADLHKLEPGDRIVVRDDSGADIVFIVRESRKYDAEADTIGVFSSVDGKEHLNLITCDGTWDEREEQYSERLVVFADRAKE